MACGKPPNPDAMTPPSAFDHPSIDPAIALLQRVEDMVRWNKPSASVDAAIAAAMRAVDRARAFGQNAAYMRRLEGRLSNIKGLATQHLKANILGLTLSQFRRSLSPAARQLVNGVSEAAARRNASSVIRALLSNDHWQSKAYQTYLVRLVEGTQSIPSHYKDRLPRDVAIVLRACPHAGGLVKELTYRGQHGATGSVSKLGSRSNSAVGSAYELMATSALIQAVSHASNAGAPPLRIRSGLDKLTFGDKCNVNRMMGLDGQKWDMPTRRSIECDIRIAQDTLSPFGPREIGVDFKHAKDDGMIYTSKDRQNQVDNVVRVIRDGQLDEYHFVTNGTFGESFKTAVAAANKGLVRDGLTAIAYHEHVSSPHA